MADITAFPAIQDVLISGDNVREFTATEAITAGMLVGYAATGVDNAVVPMDATADEQCIGVAIKDAAATAKVKVALDGCIVKVVNADDTTAIEAGVYVEDNDNALQGTVSVLAMTKFSANHNVAGITQEAVAGAGYGSMLVQVGQQVNST